MRSAEIKRVLLAVHDGSQRVSLQKSIKDMGFTVESVHQTSESALQNVVSELPDVAVIDSELAGIMNGYECARQMREHFRIPVVLLSNGSRDAFQKCLACAPDAVISKPVDRIALQWNLHSLLGNSTNGHDRSNGQIQAFHSIDGITRDLAKAMNAVVLILDARARIANVYPSAYPPFLTTDASPFGKSAADFFPVKDRARFLDIHAQVMGSGKQASIEWKQQGANESHWFQATLVPQRDRNVICIVQNVSGRRTAEQDVALLVHAIRSIRDGVYVTTIDESIVFVNSAMAAMHGYDAVEMLGMPIRSLYGSGGSDRLHQLMYQTTIEYGWQGELVHARKDGSTFPVSVSTSVVRNDLGKPVAIVGVVFDITDRQIHERELREARNIADHANRLKSEFLANMGHEFRTPLNVISGATSVLEEEMAEIAPDTFDMFFLSIKQAIQRLLDTIQKIVDVSKLQIGDFPFAYDIVNVVDVVEGCAGILKPIAQRKRLDFQVRIERDDIPVYGDIYALNRAMYNLIENAIKYTAQGGVEVELRQTAPDFVQIAIRDTGVGINEEYLPHVFEEFSQEVGGYGRPFEGTGLGLSLSHKFILACKGTITIKSTKGVGTEVLCTFPIHHITPAAETESRQRLPQYC